MDISIHVVRQIHNGVTVMSLSGELTLLTGPKVRSALLKCASECPTGIIVDLAELDRSDKTVLGVFPTASHRSQQDWGVPVVLSGPTTEIAAHLAPFRTFVTICGNQHDALLVLRTWAPRWVHRRLSNDARSVYKAAGLVGDACLAWGVTHIRAAARLVMSELVTNALTHAGTDVDITASYTGRYLRIAVHDGSTTLPRLAPGDSDGSPAQRHGLHIVRDTAALWSTTPLPNGKIVWALLRTTRDSNRPVTGAQP